MTGIRPQRVGGQVLRKDGRVCTTCCGVAPECPVYTPGDCPVCVDAPEAITVPAEGSLIRVLVRGYARSEGTRGDGTAYVYQGSVDWSGERFENGCARTEPWATAPYNGGSDPATQPRIELLRVSDDDPDGTTPIVFWYLAFRLFAGLMPPANTAIAAPSQSGGAAGGGGDFGTLLAVTHPGTSATSSADDGDQTNDRTLTVAWSAQAVPGRRVSTMAYTYAYTFTNPTPGSVENRTDRLAFEVILYGPVLIRCDAGPTPICDPDPAFGDPPEWFDPEEAGCPGGCAPGPVGYRVVVPAGEAIPAAPDEAAWTAKGGTWACARTLQFVCPSGHTVYWVTTCADIDPGSPSVFCPDAPPTSCEGECVLGPLNGVLLDGEYVSTCYYLWVLENLGNPGEPDPLPEGCVKTPGLACLDPSVRTFICNTASGPVELRYRVPCGFVGTTPQFVLDLCAAIQGAIGIP